MKATSHVETTMRAALHRSITFWSGLLVMGFILWAWGDSMESVSSAHLRGCHLIQAAGGVAAGFTPDPSQPLIVRRIERSHEVMTTGGRYEGFAEQKPQLVSRWPQPRRCAVGPGLFLPHWLILLTVASVWLGLLFWRARRRRLAIH